LRVRVFDLVWSPDSAYFFDSRSTLMASHPISGFEIRSKDGVTVSTKSEATPVGWVDSRHVLAYTGLGSSFDETGYAANAQAVVVGLDGSQAIENIPYRGGPLTSGYGPVAIPHCDGEDAPTVPKCDFVVWSNGQLSETRPGYPFEWSRNEKTPTLAVLHPLEPTRGIEGWLEVLSWPDLGTVYEDQPHEQIGTAYFDPHGDFIAFEKSEPDAHVRIATTWGTKPFDFPESELGRWFWTQYAFNVIDNAGVMRSWDGLGNLVAIRPAPAAFARSSDDGRTVLYWNDEVGNGSALTHFAVAANDTTTDVTLPSAPVYFPGNLAPDGSAIALVSDDAVYLRDLSH
jgi:hypothetical protein